jgi:argininosuccinate synthase
MEKVVLAYSGGLDTSVILKWLLEKGYDVVAYIADVGQAEDFTKAKEKALKIGASKVYVEDLKEEFVKDYIFTALKGSAVYENRYLLGTSLARPLIAKRHIEIAEKEKAAYVSHGATGKGNDQVRFELGYYALKPDIKIIAPWKTQEFLDQFEGRTDLLNYADKHGIEVTASKKAPYSTDPNLMHISYEAGILEDPKASPPQEMFQMTVSPQNAPDASTKISIDFKEGIPVKVTNKDSGESVTGAYQILCYLNEIGGKNGIGRIDIVENRYVGIKSRGVYETPGGTILWKAHEDLETISLDREVYRIKQLLMPKFADLIYNGYWFSPEMDLLIHTFNKTQEEVSGCVDIELYKGNVSILGRKADNNLYNPDLASMDIGGGYDQKDAAGFIRINAVRLRAAYGCKKNS